VNRPPFEVADIIRQHENSFIEKNRSWLTWHHLRVLHAIEHCRTSHWAAISIAVPDAVIAPSPTTLAVIGIARSA
jgi:hypothetical protein